MSQVDLLSTSPQIRSCNYHIDHRFFCDGITMTNPKIRLRKDRSPDFVERTLGMQRKQLPLSTRFISNPVNSARNDVYSGEALKLLTAAPRNGERTETERREHNRSSVDLLMWPPALFDEGIQNSPGPQIYFNLIKGI